MKSYCIMCGEKKAGIAVKGDRVIRSIRWFKKNVTKNEKGHGLVVCRSCYPEYTKRLAKYRSRQAIYLVLGVLFVISELIISPSAISLLIGLLMLAVLYLFSLLNYAPRLDVDALPKKPGGKG